jgi:hypothetical protein
MTRRKSIDIGTDLRAWLVQNAMTEQEFADAVNSANPGRRKVGQPWVSRVCNGHFRRLSGNTAVILQYANIETDYANSSHPDGHAVIDAALDNVWDGSLEGAKVIARLLREAAALTKQNSRSVT